jgi:hypothetical protein
MKRADSTSEGVVDVTKRAKGEYNRQGTFTPSVHLT